MTAPEPTRSPPGHPTSAIDPPTQPLQAVSAPVDGAPSGRTDAQETPDHDQVGAPALPAAPWTFVDVFAGLGVVLLLSLLLGAPLQFANVKGGSALLVLSALPVWIGLLGTTLWASRRHGTGSLVRDLALRFRWADLWIGLGAGLGLRIVIGVWTVLYSSITGQRPTGNLDAVLGDGLGTGVWLVVNVAAIAVIGPAIEEIFFRGLGLRSALASLWRRAGVPPGRFRRIGGRRSTRVMTFARRWHTPSFADPRRRVRYSIAATSLIFTLLHISEVSDLTSAVVLLPGLFLAGWVLARLTIWSGRLGPAIVTHVVFNGLAVVALLALG